MRVPFRSANIEWPAPLRPAENFLNKRHGCCFVFYLRFGLRHRIPGPPKSGLSSRHTACNRIGRYYILFDGAKTKNRRMFGIHQSNITRTYVVSLNGCLGRRVCVGDVMMPDEIPVRLFATNTYAWHTIGSRAILNLDVIRR